MYASFRDTLPTYLSRPFKSATPLRSRWTVTRLTENTLGIMISLVESVSLEGKRRLMRNRVVVLCLLVALFGISALAQGKPVLGQEEVAISRAALDYVEGWYQGDAERMDRALHPDFVKRAPLTLPTGKEVLKGASKQTMVEMTRAGGGTNSPYAKQKCEVTVFDVHEKLASAKVVSGDYVDYLHLLKTDGAWKIVNVLWLPLRPMDAK